jgi:suppressor of G2 allele of SKP1
MDQAKKGAEALEARNYAEAIQLYSEAIKSNSNAVNYYIQRSIAYQRSSPPNNAAALADTEVAVVLAHKRASRELIAKAQLRRAIILFGLERFRDAEYVFGIAKSKDPKEKTLNIWEAKIKKKLAELDDGDERGKLQVEEIPHAELPGEPKKESVSTLTKAKPDEPAAPPPPAVQQTPVDKIKHEWYQNNDFVFFTLLAKGVPKDKASVDIDEHSLSISFPTQTSSTYDFSLDPLFAPIDAAQSTWNIMATKVEVKLKKATPGTKWKNLQGDPTVATESTEGTTSSIPQHILTSKPADLPPSYPTSSKTGPKDWDKVANDLTKKPKKEGEKDTGDGSLDDDDFEGGDDVTNFFKKLYQNADPDTRRAMIKSYQESNGTELSTDWGNVGTRKVETVPPDGMVAKKWGE